MALVSTQDVREALEWSPTLDAKAERLAKIVTAQWEGFTRRLWQLRTDYIHRVELSEFERVILLPLHPLTAIDVVAWADGEIEPADFTTPLVRDTDYVVNLTTGEVTILQVQGSNWFFIDWRHPDNWFKFELTGGYDATTLLTAHDQGEMIKQVLLLQAQYEYERNRNETIISTSISLGGPEMGSSGLRGNRFHPEFVSVAEMYRTHLE